MQCHGDCLDQGGIESNRIFDEMLVAAGTCPPTLCMEEAILEIGESPELDNHRCEQEEFRFLTAEIITTVNLTGPELQTFLALWWLGILSLPATIFATCSNSLWPQPMELEATSEAAGKEC
ncbi:MAG: hypothetical protein IPO00_03195 [Betaproteobacteria bacterium]|nr:hypothetical protein [Betaproteobacteria bacterium]